VEMNRSAKVDVPMQRYANSVDELLQRNVLLLYHPRGEDAGVYNSSNRGKGVKR